MELNERQVQQSMTCLNESNTIAYCFLAGIEEHGELIEKMLWNLKWAENKDKELENLLEAIKCLCLNVGKHAKRIRHGSEPIPFDLFPSTDKSEKRAIMLEVGDLEWDMNNLLRKLGYTAEECAKANWEKCSKRWAAGTTDGQGDYERKPIDE